MAQRTSISPEDCSPVAQEWLRHLNKAGESGDLKAFSQLLSADGWIRGAWIATNTRRSFYLHALNRPFMF